MLLYGCPEGRPSITPYLTVMSGAGAGGLAGGGDEACGDGAGWGASGPCGLAAACCEPGGGVGGDAGAAAACDFCRGACCSGDVVGTTGAVRAEKSIGSGCFGSAGFGG